MTALHQKLNQLSLTSMARQLDQTIAEAAHRNRSFAETLEWLVDFELDSRNSRSIERRFRQSRLHAKESIDSFHFKHHKSRMRNARKRGAEEPHRAPVGSGVHRQRHQRDFHR